MTTSATAVWRVRPSGNNNNGGGFDCAISSAATGTHGSFSGTTFTDATANAFTAGMVGSSIRVDGLGQYKITAQLSASQITLGSGAPPAIPTATPVSWTVGSGQDYSQQNAAQLSQSNPANCSTATTTLTDTGASFTTALIGNAIFVSGTGITSTYTYITAVPTATTLTLQTSPGTAGTNVSYNIGGAWADYWTNTNTTIGADVSGNIIYVLGSGVPNSASYTYDYTYSGAAVATKQGVGGNPNIRFMCDPATSGYKPLPDLTGGMPVTQVGANFMSGLGGVNVQQLWFVSSAASTTTSGVLAISGTGVNVYGCVLDQFGFDSTLINAGANSGYRALWCEAFSSVVPGASGSNYAINRNGGGLVSAVVKACNVHDTVGLGIYLYAYQNETIEDTIIAKTRGEGVRLHTPGSPSVSFKNNTVDATAGNGLIMVGGFIAQYLQCTGNIFSNITAVGAYGINAGANDDWGKFLIDYNVFYNNTNNLLNLSYGPHDTILSQSPYATELTENYTLA